jgi:DHA2 family multidrug resistance protein
MTETVAERPLNRLAVTAFVMIAGMMQTLDTTIANVALTHIQGGLSASITEVEWVLTSYIVASAIMTPPSGWLAGRFGQKRLFLVALAGFVVASAFCGLATSLDQMILARTLQGAFGAPLMPISQAILLDIYPRERQAAAMAVWNAAGALGPVLGPTLGGWITEDYTWRWVFFINIPFGLIAFFGFLATMPRRRSISLIRLDWFGFITLSLGIGAFQLMLDRGDQLDWFSAPEIVAETTAALLALYLFVVQIFTTANPFVAPRLFYNRKYISGTFLAAMNTLIVFGSITLTSLFLQNVQGYSSLQSGLLMAPRGIGSGLMILVMSRVVSLVETRLLISIGMSINVFVLWQMTRFNADVSAATIMSTGVLQGIAVGIAFVPSTMMAFASIAPEDRAQGAAFFTLVRNLAASLSITCLTNLLSTGIRANHADIVAYVTPTNWLFQMPRITPFWNPATPGGAALLDQEITRQATTIAFIDDFRALFLVASLSLPLILIAGGSRRGGEAVTVAAD